MSAYEDNDSGLEQDSDNQEDFEQEDYEKIIEDLEKEED